MLLAYSRMQQNAMTIQGPSYDSPMIFNSSWLKILGGLLTEMNSPTDQSQTYSLLRFLFFAGHPPKPKLHLINTFILYDTPNHPNTQLESFSLITFAATGHARLARR